MSSSTQPIDGDELFTSNIERDSHDPDESLYTEWLMGALEQGVVPDNFRARTPHHEPRRHRIVTRDSTIPANHENDDRIEPIKYVIPEHVNVDADHSGEEYFYYMDGFETGPHTPVEVFDDEIEEVVKKYPEAIEESGGAAFMLSASCTECHWDSGLTENPDHLLHEISKHTAEADEGSNGAHGVTVTEVVVTITETEDGKTETGEIMYERRYNASL